MTLFTRLLPLAIIAAAPAAAVAAPVTIKAGDSWVFAVEGGQPVRARKVTSSTKAGPGQIKATVVSTMGTTMTVTNNSRVSYTFQAELLGAPSGKSRTCTLPASGGPVLEYWPVKATAVRLSTFKVASADGNCP